MLKRFLIIIVLIAIAAFCVIYLVHYNFKAPAKKAAAVTPRAMTQAAFAELAKKHNAIDSWDNELCQGAPARMTPILTMELEKIWLTARPILFIGKITDIKTQDKANYRLIIDRDLYLAALLFVTGLRTRLGVSLLCPKTMVDSFIAANPDYLEAGNGVGGHRQDRDHRKCGSHRQGYRAGRRKSRNGQWSRTPVPEKPLTRSSPFLEAEVV